MKKLEVSFNSPQCGWMSIGFYDGANEFHTTTAHTPHSRALSEILGRLAALLDDNDNNDNEQDEFTIAWSRNPEAYDLYFRRDGERIFFKVIEYPTDEQRNAQGERVFEHEGNVKEFCAAFYPTFEQLYRDRDTDDFEFHWRQPFPFEEFERFKSKLQTAEG